MKVDTATAWIERLGLKPHPEGGYYNEVFRSGVGVHRAGKPAERAACTSIYYLLEGDDYSGFHRLASDELWYFHAGEPLQIHRIDAAGRPAFHLLSLRAGDSLSVAIPAGTWFAAELPGKTGFALCSCAVAPGFEFSEFEMGKKDALLRDFPAASTVIERLSR